MRDVGVLQQAVQRPVKRPRTDAGGHVLPNPPNVAAAHPQQPLQPRVILEFLSPEVPVRFFCPISWRVMRDPVIDTKAGGISWERSAILDYLYEHDTNPITGGLLVFGQPMSALCTVHPIDLTCDN